MAVFIVGKGKKPFAYSVTESSAFTVEIQNRLVSGTEKSLWSGLQPGQDLL